MFKIVLSGKAGVGKNLVAKILGDGIRNKTNCQHRDIKQIALADPVKEIAKIMFPKIKNTDLYGSSKNRANLISGESSLSIRQILLDIGTKFGRSYNQNIWLNVFDDRIKDLKKHVIVIDARFINELQHMKKKNFFLIRVIRDTKIKINHITEYGQDDISDSNFDFILNNNGSIDDLRRNITAMLAIIPT